MEAAASGVCSTEANTWRQGPAQLLGQDPLDDRPGLGGHLVAAPLELGHQGGREDAVTRGDDLAQLDVGGAELLEGDAQAPRQAGHRGLAALAVIGDVPEAEGAPEVAQRGADAGAGRDPAPAHEAGERRRERRPEHGLVAAPGQGVRVDHPGPDVGEDAESRVGGHESGEATKVKCRGGSSGARRDGGVSC